MNGWVSHADTLVVPKLDRLARSVPDARDIGDTLAKGGVSLSLGGQIYDPDDPMGKLSFNILATFAEFEVELIRMRTREGMAVARAAGKLKGRQPKLSAMHGELKTRTERCSTSHGTGFESIDDIDAVLVRLAEGVVRWRRTSGAPRAGARIAGHICSAMECPTCTMIA